MMANKVTHVINCTGLTLGNLFEPLGILYLTFPWSDLDQEVIRYIHNITIQIYGIIKK